jgi:hypothetical protein
MHVDVGIADLILGRPITDYEQHGVHVSSVQEPVPVARARWKASAHTGAQRFFACVRFQDDFTRQHVDELVLPRVPMPGGGLSSRLDPRNIHPEVRQSYVVAEPPIPASLVLGAVGFRIAGRIALGQTEGVEPHGLFAHLLSSLNNRSGKNEEQTCEG